MRRIPSARFFDLDAVSDKSSTLPHMLPAVGTFSAAMRSLDVSLSRPVVIYDATGVSSAAARVAFTLRAFGHKSAHVLDGGLPRWLKEGREMETNKLNTSSPTHPNPSMGLDGWALSSNYVRDIAAIRALNAGGESKSDTLTQRQARELVVDARPALRFTGAVPEPRPIPSGHMARARSVPSASLTDATGALLPVEALRAAFKAGGVDVGRKGPLVLSCGSGVMACTLWLALRVCGRPEGFDSVYDGSWTEWATVAQDTKATDGLIKAGPADPMTSDY